MDRFEFEEQKATSLRHVVTNNIRRAIFDGKLKPGSRLRELDISRQMGVSRGPIREAMRVLEQEGLLYSHPYKETTVAEVTEEEALEVLIPIRLVIEQFAIRKIIAELDDSHFKRLRSIVAEMREGVKQQNFSKVVDCDLAFHEYLVSLCDSSNLMGIWISIYNRIRLVISTQGQSYEDLNVLCEDHERLIQALETKNLSHVSRLLHEHIHDGSFGV